MKRLFLRGVCLCLCFALLVPAVLADTAPTSPIDLFSYGVCTAGEYPLDYAWYSPVVDDTDTEKYPLVIWLHGYSYGGSPGEEILSSTIAFWATPEMQEEFFDTGGAFVLVPRAPEDFGLYWSEELTDSLMTLILEFLFLNRDHIDMDRIYLGGHSLGGMMCWKLAIEAPELFAALFLASPYYAPTDAELEILADTPIWIVSSIYDQVTDYDTLIAPTWKRIKQLSNVPEQCRLSVLGTLFDADGAFCANAHQSWRPVLHNLLTTRGESYFRMITVDGNGQELTLDRENDLIGWLCSQRGSGGHGGPHRHSSLRS